MTTHHNDLRVKLLLGHSCVHDCDSIFEQSNNKSIDFLQMIQNALLPFQDEYFFPSYMGGANLYGLIFSYYGQNKQINSSVSMNGEIRSIKGFHVFFACCNVVQNSKVNYSTTLGEKNTVRKN